MKLVKIPTLIPECFYSVRRALDGAWNGFGNLFVSAKSKSLGMSAFIYVLHCPSSSAGLLAGADPCVSCDMHDFIYFPGMLLHSIYIMRTDIYLS